MVVAFIEHNKRSSANLSNVRRYFHVVAQLASDIARLRTGCRIACVCDTYGHLKLILVTLSPSSCADSLSVLSLLVVRGSVGTASVRPGGAQCGGV